MSVSDLTSVPETDFTGNVMDRRYGIGSNNKVFKMNYQKLSTFAAFQPILNAFSQKCLKKPIFHIYPRKEETYDEFKDIPTALEFYKDGGLAQQSGITDAILLVLYHNWNYSYSKPGNNIFKRSDKKYHMTFGDINELLIKSIPSEVPKAIPLPKYREQELDLIVEKSYDMAVQHFNKNNPFKQCSEESPEMDVKLIIPLQKDKYKCIFCKQFPFPDPIWCGKSSNASVFHYSCFRKEALKRETDSRFVRAVNTMRCPTERCKEMIPLAITVDNLLDVKKYQKYSKYCFYCKQCDIYGFINEKAEHYLTKHPNPSNGGNNSLIGDELQHRPTTSNNLNNNSNVLPDLQDFDDLNDLNDFNPNETQTPEISGLELSHQSVDNNGATEPMDTEVQTANELGGDNGRQSQPLPMSGANEMDSNLNGNRIRSPEASITSVIENQEQLFANIIDTSSRVLFEAIHKSQTILGNGILTHIRNEFNIKLENQKNDSEQQILVLTKELAKKDQKIQRLTARVVGFSKEKAKQTRELRQQQRQQQQRLAIQNKNKPQNK